MEKDYSKSGSCGVSFSQLNYDSNATSESRTSASVITTCEGERGPSTKQGDVCILSFSSDSQTSSSRIANSESDMGFSMKQDVYAPVILESSSVVCRPRSPITYNFFS